MKRATKIKCLRIWRPRVSRIRSKYFLKSQILFGTDRSADIPLENVSGLYARLDFDASEIHFLEDDRIKRVGPGELFQMGNYVFQWKKIDVLKRKGLLSGVTVLALGVLILFIFSFLKNETTNEDSRCSPRAERLLRGLWTANNASDEIFFKELSALKASFSSALRSHHWAKARAELDGMGASLEVEDCDFESVLRPLEFRLSKSLIFFYLSESNLKAAVTEIVRFKAKYPGHELDRLEVRVLREARRLYFEGYRLEEEDPLKGGDIMEEAEQICRTLGRDTHCFRTSLEAKAALPIHSKQTSR
jgi:hypothetical protein